MQPCRTIEGSAVALPIANLDTDQIMPKQFLRGIDKTGLDGGLLYDLRFDAQGAPRPDCVLNQPALRHAPILVGGPNFGCGSSREHAVWGLMQYGFRAVIAPSFGEIFYANALNNGLLVAQVSPADGEALLDAATAGASLAIDVATQTIRWAARTTTFALSARSRTALLEGLDMIGATLQDREAIAAFAAAHAQRRPWLHGVGRKAWAQTHPAGRTDHA